MDTMVVTGGSAGIGAAIAARFREEGARVINLSRRPCPVEGVSNVSVDLLQPAAVEGALAEVRQIVGQAGVIHLVHNAAMMPSDSADLFDSDRCLQALQLNVVAPAALTAGLLPSMAPGSSVLFIGSTLSEQGVAGRLSYVASKHAVVGVMRATVQDLFGRHIHAACICPGFTDTEMLRPLLEANPEVDAAVRGMVSFGRLLDPREIADLVAFAAANPSLNGAVIHANLGQRTS